uniref:Rad21/Rec8-like protein N-terminal domain-containing protein n=1 Tax=Bionectria ochroleuca TaxID=29856 RepID=A0A8H7NKB5_BIOOC
MFYSHEILTNTQYGVATIWLVATVGKGTQKKVSRKLIQEVNVPRACEKILDPGAPLALRLQASLLYGVSRVFSQQCNYVLSDAERTQTEMVSYFKSMQQSETDPQAGKTKRHNIVLEDDPTFDPQILQASNTSSNQYSHLTPLTSQNSGSVGRKNSRFSINLPESSLSARSYHIPSDFGQQSPSGFKPFHRRLSADVNPFDDDDDALGGMVGLEIDADGNILELLDNEPVLPPLPNPEDIEMGEDLGQQNTNNRLAKNFEALVLGDEELLPDAEAFPIQAQAANLDRLPSSTPSLVPSSPNMQVAHSRRGRPRKANVLVDEREYVSHREMGRWDLEYLDNMDAVRKDPAKATLGQAKKNAWAFLFDNGVANVGLDFVPNPLAEDFAGHQFMANLLGPDFADQFAVKEVKERRGRRKRSEAFTPEEEAKSQDEHLAKRVNNEEVEIARNDEPVILGEEPIPELGMGTAAGPLSDRHSSAIMPWSRQGSVMPGSSVRGSAQKAGHGSILQSIERYSDVGFGSDFSAQVPLQNAHSQSGGLDIASQNFLAYATAEADKVAAPDNKGRTWVDFEQLATPGVHDRHTAAQAFLHVLSLATKNEISVRQTGSRVMEPFGAIHVGLPSSSRGAARSERAE